MKVDSLKLGATCAIVWAGAILGLGLISSALNWGTPFMNTLASLYLGYGKGLGGAIIGSIWALADGFCGGFVVGLVYNKLPKMGDI
ncbi:hypothetical protein ACFLZ2_01515 [Candidatus Margulisiibacteriota bacterium]